jgi:hypothetical protein
MTEISPKNSVYPTRMTCIIMLFHKFLNVISNFHHQHWTVIYMEYQTRFHLDSFSNIIWYWFHKKTMILQKQIINGIRSSKQKWWENKRQKVNKTGKTCKTDKITKKIIWHYMRLQIWNCLHIDIFENWKDKTDILNSFQKGREYVNDNICPFIKEIK